jgi:FO synthase subunit 2
MLAQNSKVTVEDSLSSFKDAGLDTMTGASAEILVDSVEGETLPQ